MADFLIRRDVLENIFGRRWGAAFENQQSTLATVAAASEQTVADTAQLKDAAFVTLSANAELPNERVLTLGDGLEMVVGADVVLLRLSVDGARVSGGHKVTFVATGESTVAVPLAGVLATREWVAGQGFAGDIAVLTTRVTALEGVSISAGTGLVGGGDLTASRTISAGPILAAYAGGDTPSAFVLGIVDSADAAAFRSNIGLSDNAVQTYSDGPCTLTLTDSAGNSATMGGANAARYVRIGSLVVVSGTLNWTSTAALSAGSRLRIAGLPVAATAASGYRAAASFGSAASGSFNVTRSEIAFGVDAGNSFVWGTKVSGNNVDGNLTKADIGNSGTLFGFTLSYHV